jgi:transcriptional antiterminator RfaH
MSTITWCVAHTQPFKEITAKQHLLDQGYEVYLPRFKKVRRHARKVEEVLTPLFPRYIFVGMDLETTLWRSINSTRGVSHLLMRQNLPASIPLQIMDDLRSQEIEDQVLPITSLTTFIKGERLRILEGVFKDQVASFKGLDDKSRIKLLLTFMGREMQITLPNYAVEAA